MSKTKRVLKYLLLITIVVTSFRVALFSLKFILASEFPLVIVEGVSMERTYYSGDLLAVKGVEDKHSIKLLDIIVFHEPYNRDILIVHRVVQINYTSLEFKTKGDNGRTNPVSDPWTVREADIVGVVIARVPSAGPVFMAIESPAATIVMVILLVVEYVGYSRGEGRKKGEGSGKIPL